MNLKEFQLAHRKYCGRQISGKKCDATRNMQSERCMKCTLAYLDSQASLEQFDPKADVSNRAPQFATLSDADVRNGLQNLLGIIRNGNARFSLPVGARPVISGMVFEVVDHDTVKVDGHAHTMTLRFLSRDYHEMPFDSRNGSSKWHQSNLRDWLNNDFFGKLSAPLQEVILAVPNVTVNACGTVVGETPSLDKVWIPSASQVGLTAEDDIAEGDVLDAFDRELTIDSNSRRIIAEYHGDEIVPKSYWLRTEQCEDNHGKVCCIDRMGKMCTLAPYESTAMVVPYITIG